jgi:hypothetical protein
MIMLVLLSLSFLATLARDQASEPRGTPSIWISAVGTSAIWLAEREPAAS